MAELIITLGFGPCLEGGRTMSYKLPIILIIFGIGFLLHNLGIIGFTPWILLWPGVLIWFGLQQLIQISKERRGSQDSWEIALWLVVVTVGVYLLLPKIGITVPSIPWKLIWPLFLVILGIMLLFPGKKGKAVFKVHFQPGGKTQMREYKRAFMGEFVRGPGSWVLDDSTLHHSIGTVNLDLTHAIIPEREVFLDISGYVGEASIYLPPGLPFKAECSIGLGEITVLDQHESGSGRYVQIQSEGYDQATKKVNIQVHWKIGEINIRQIR